jgi:dephospho-CoA kinase
MGQRVNDLVRAVPELNHDRGGFPIYRVGLTGGIASGKTTVAEMLAELGAGVVDTDDVAREVVEPGETGLESIKREFGADVLLETGQLDRAAMRRLVFQDTDARSRLEAILHPLIRERTLARVGELDSPYAVIVVPLLVETDFDKIVDRVVVVDCPRETQLERLMQRDGIDEAAAETMLAAQTDRELRNARADDLIDNSASKSAVREQARALHGRLLALALEAGSGD